MDQLTEDFDHPAKVKKVKYNNWLTMEYIKINAKSIVSAHLKATTKLIHVHKDIGGIKK